MAAATKRLARLSWSTDPATDLPLPTRIHWRRARTGSGRSALAVPHDRLRSTYRLLAKLAREERLFVYLAPELEGLKIASSTNQIEGGINAGLHDLLSRSPNPNPSTSPLEQPPTTPASALKKASEPEKAGQSQSHVPPWCPHGGKCERPQTAFPQVRGHIFDVSEGGLEPPCP